MVGMLADLWEGRPPLTEPVVVRLTFTFPWLVKHYRTGKSSRLLRDDAPTIHDTTPDLDKLVRLVFDALTVAGVWRDDCIGSDLRAVKRWGPTGATQIHLRKAGE
jgi:Holliday junction resolvase RusA-like endonuclease